MALPTAVAYPLPAAGEVPSSKAAWTPARGRAALLIHDMQRYFLRVFQADASPIEPVLANIDALRARCDALGIPVFYTAQLGDQDQKERGLQTAFWGPGMRDVPEDRDIAGRIAPAPNHQVLTKWRYSAFQKSDFETRLREGGRDQLLITGVFAHIGCLMTAADAFMRDIEPFFVADAVADFSRERHDQAVEYAASRCAVAVTTARLLAEL
jgi:bifunctional isochorismate lyase / aryl carrier protein